MLNVVKAFQIYVKFIKNRLIFLIKLNIPLDIETKISDQVNPWWWNPGTLADLIANLTKVNIEISNNQVVMVTVLPILFLTLNPLILYLTVF